MAKLVSIIIPVHNEEKNIPLVYRELKNVCDGLRNKYDHELIFIDDGSRDGSSLAIDNLATEDQRVKHIEFSRNFGKEMATSSGILHARGDAAIMIDADLQHPPRLIPEFIEKWENGADVIVGVRIKNNGEGFIKKYGSSAFYKIMNAIGDIKLTPRATDYRLIDRKVIAEFNRFTERNRITRGIIDWLGFKKDFIYFEASERLNGKASYGYPKLAKLALSSFVSHSLFPLKLAGYLGVFITFFSGLFGIFMIAEKFFFKDYFAMEFSGPAMLAVMILFLIGIVLSSLGLVALYIANIHNEVINRPIYVVRRKNNFN